MSTISLTTSSFSLVGGVVNMHLEGTTDCHDERLTILVLCDNQEQQPVIASITHTPAGGTWVTDIHVCKCGQAIKIMAKCGAPNSSSPYQQIGATQVACPGASCCPTVTTSVVLGECHSDGTRTVTLNSTINLGDHCPPVTLTWDFGDGATSQSNTYTQSGGVVNLIATHNFRCGTAHTPTLHVLCSDFGCPSQPLPIDVPCCGCCPTLALQSKALQCDSSGNRAVEVQYTITPSSSPGCGRINGILSMPGLAPIAIASSSLSGSMTLPPLAPGTYTATLSLSSPASCPPVEQQIVVPPCDCCPNAIVTSEVVRKCNDDFRTKHVSVTAEIIPKPDCPPVTAVMSIDGTEVATGSGSAPFTLEYAGDYGCGTHPVTISYPGMECPPGGGSFCVPVCETPGCKVTRNVLAFAATVGVISWILYLFSSITSLLILAIVATVFTIIYCIQWKPCLKECKDCLCRLILWQIALASFAGGLMLSKSIIQMICAALAVYVSAALSVIIIALVLIIIAFIIYLLYLCWVGKCCPTDCDKWSALHEAMITCTLAVGVVTSVLAIAGVAGSFIVPYAAGAFAILVMLVYCRKTIACAG